MKYYKLIVSVLLIFAYISMFSQNIVWATQGAKWWYQQRYDFGSSASTYFCMESVRDTIIEGDICSVLEFNPQYIGHVVQNHVVLKQEDKQVFYYMNDTFHLLYDFSMRLGDTIVVRNPQDIIRSFLVNEKYDTLIVTNLDSIEVNGEIRARQTVESISNFFWSDYGPTIIEGIGSVDRFFFPTFIGIADDQDIYEGLRCYQDDQIGIFKFKYIKTPCDFDTYVSINEVSPLISIKSFPNPFQNAINIELEFMEMFVHNNFKIILIDAKGQQIYSEMVQSKKYSKIFDLPTGIYFLIILNNQRPILKQKLISIF